MYNTMCSGQTPSLNFTSRTCSKNHINWYKPCRFLHLRALNVDEEGERGRAARAGRRDVMHGMMKFQCIHFNMMCHLQSICLSQLGTMYCTQLLSSATYLTTYNTYRNNTGSASAIVEKS